MTHFGKRMCHRSLEPRLFEGADAQREGGSWKGPPESALGGDDWLVERRQLKYLDVNRVVNLADHYTSILGAYVKRNCSTFGKLDGMIKVARIVGHVLYLSCIDLSEHLQASLR